MNIPKIALGLAAALLAAGCATRPSVQASQVEVDAALKQLLDALEGAKVHQVSQGRAAGLLISEASVTLALAVKEGDKQSLVIAMPGAPGVPGLTFTPFDRSRETAATHTVTVKFTGLINASLKDTLLEGVRDAVKVKDGETPEQAVARLRSALNALSGTAPAFTSSR